MSESAEVLGLHKEVLVARARLCRLKIRRDVEGVRGGFTLGSAGGALAGSAPARELALGLMIAGLGGGRVARMLSLAGRAVVLARVALAVFWMVRSASKSEPDRVA